MAYPYPGREELTDADWEEAWAHFHRREERMMTEERTEDRADARRRTAQLLKHQSERLADLAVMLTGDGDREATAILRTAYVALVAARRALEELG